MADHCPVIHSVTPNGVEHEDEQRGGPFADPVIHSVTPNGVEHGFHTFTAEAAAKCDSFGNA